MDEILLTVTAAREPITSFAALAYATERRIQSMTTTGLAALDPVEAFTGNDWVEARRRRGCLSSTFRAIGRMTCEMRGGEDDKDDVEEDETDDDTEDPYACEGVNNSDFEDSDDDGNV